MSEAVAVKMKGLGVCVVMGDAEIDGQLDAALPRL
jgi:hypothetical protein